MRMNSGAECGNDRWQERRRAGAKPLAAEFSEAINAVNVTTEGLLVRRTNVSYVLDPNELPIARVSIFLRGVSRWT